MNFSGKMQLMIILKVTKNQGFSPSKENQNGEFKSTTSAFPGLVLISWIVKIRLMRFF